MPTWIQTENALPDEMEEVWIRVRGDVRPHYYRIDDRWYARVDLDRWRMNTSPYWQKDRSWYLETEDVTAWRPIEEVDS